MDAELEAKGADLDEVFAGTLLTRDRNMPAHTTGVTEHWSTVAVGKHVLAARLKHSTGMLTAVTTPSHYHCTPANPRWLQLITIVMVACAPKPETAAALLSSPSGSPD